MSLSDQELDRRLNALDRHCTPPEKVWKTLQPELAERPTRPSRRPRLALAAAVCGLGLLGAWLLLAMQTTHDTPMAGTSGSDTARAMDEPAAGFQRSRQALAAASAENEAAIRRLEAALEHEPGNLLLKEFLAEARFRQTELIMTTAQLNLDANTP